MSNESPYFAWQREHNKKWVNYSMEECKILNKAYSKHQKKVTLPSSDPKKKLTVNLEKMLQKNIISGFEQRVRCLIYNNSYHCWLWQDDYDDFTCYTPRIAFYLEVILEKKLEKTDIVIKDEYEINFNQMTQMNKRTNNIRSIRRDNVEVLYLKEAVGAHYANFKSCLVSDILIKKLSKESENRIKNILFDLPISGPQDTSGLDSPFSAHLPSTSHQEIISALSAEVQASTSVEASITSVPVDPDCLEAANCHVFSENSNIYNATLNFTNLQENNNKFFIIQLLKFHKKKMYAVWYHWGRVGYKGQNSLINFGSNLAEAKLTFEKKFYEKTRNNWSERHDFKKVASKYDLLHMDISLEVSKPLLTAETKLDKRIQDLLQVICNKKNLEDAAKEMSYDSSATPLGKITAKQILEGYTALNSISEILKKEGKGLELIEACNNFYTKIPHAFGRRTPTLIGSMDDVKEKLKMLEALSNICLAMDVLNSTAEGAEHPIDKYYRNLECNLTPLDHTSEEFSVLRRCILETHGPTHSAYSMEIIDAFKCEKENQNCVFEDFGNKHLLWHGSRIANWIGILKKGLQIAPREAPSTGYMFGKGIYFADVCSKSANYCFPTKRQTEGLLLLSEVSLGTSLNVHHATDLSDLPRDFKGVFGVGRFQPKHFERTVLSPDASLAFGPLEENDIEDLSLVYNEYVVYNIRQAKMKYLLRVGFKF